MGTDPSVIHPSDQHLIFLIFHSETNKDTACAVSLFAILSKTEANPVGAETPAKN